MDVFILRQAEGDLRYLNGEECTEAGFPEELAEGKPGKDLALQLVYFEVPLGSPKRRTGRGK